MAFTKKPCPGCGQVDRDRPADQVCRTCRSKLDRIAEIERQGAALQQQVAATLTTTTEPHIVYIPEHCYMLPPQAQGYDSADYRQFADATAELFTALTAPLNRGRKPVNDYGYRAVPVVCEFHLTETSREHRGAIEIVPDAFQVTRNWWKALASWSNACYALGVNSGRNLLGQLASGDLTMDQFNDEALRQTRRSR